MTKEEYLDLRKRVERTVYDKYPRPCPQLKASQEYYKCMEGVEAFVKELAEIYPKVSEWERERK